MDQDPLLLATLLNHTPDLIYFKDLHGRYIRISRSLANKLGLQQPEDAIGKTDADFLSDDQADSIAAQDRAVLETGEPVIELEEELVWPDGRKTWVCSNKRPLHNAAGQIVGVVAISREITRRRKAEASLAEANVRLQSVLDAATQISIIATDRNGLIRVFNSGAQRMLGYRAEELVGRQTPQILHLDEEVQQRGRVLSHQFGRPVEGFEVFVTIAREQGFERREWTYVRKTGEQVLVNLVVTAVHNESGELSGYLGIAEDISERKRAEQELRSTQERFALAVRGSSDGLWDWNVVTNEVYYAPRFKELLGFQEHEFENTFEQWETRLHPDDHQKTLAWLREHLRNRVPYDVEYRLKVKSGDYRWFRARGQAVWDPRGNPTRMAGSITDITTRKRAENELKESEQRFKTLVSHAPEAIVLLDVTSGRLLDGNDHALQLFKVSREKLGTLHPADLSPARQPNGLSSQTAAESHIRRTMQRGSAVFDWVHCDSQGNSIPCEVRLVRLPGQAPMLRASITDISERKRVETALREAKEAAEAANQAKSEFVANMSHEVRTPLNGIIGMAELALDSELSEMQREYLGALYESAETLESIVNEVLDFSKIEAGKLVLENRSFSLEELLETAVRPLAIKAHAKDLAFAVEVDHTLPDQWIGDPDRIRQILTNLIGNGIKFTAEGEVTMRLSALGEESARQLLVEVQDSGIGIAADKQAEIFEPFAQADTSTTRRFGGTGLGLTISRHLAQCMGGRIEVQSEPGEGSLFRCWLELKVDRERPDRRSPAPLPPGSAVLIADHHEATARSLAELLRRWDIEPLVAVHPAELRTVLEDLQSRPLPLAAALVSPQLEQAAAVCELLREFAVSRETPRVALIRAAGKPSPLVDAAAKLMQPASLTRLAAALRRALGQSTPSPSSRRAESIAAPITGPLRVLLVEDGKINQKLATGLLEKHHHHVTVANNGREATEAFARQPFDIVLMDVQMPEMDGLQATRRIREHEAGTGRPRTPIIAMTARAMKGDRETCLAAGMDEYLAKPIRGRQLYELIDQTMGIVRQQAAQNVAPDWELALQGMNGNHGLLANLVRSFLQDLPARRASLWTALRDTDHVELRQTAHAFKVPLQVFSAKPAAELAARLERMGRDERWDQADAITADMLRMIDSMLPALQRFADESPADEL